VLGEKSTVGGVFIWIGAKYGVKGVWPAIVALQAIEVACKKDPVEDIGHGIGWICRAINFEESEDASLGPLLCCEVLYIYVSCPATGSVVDGHAGGAFVVFSCRCSCGEGETKVREELSEILDHFAGVAARDDL
jgi:hypothetical protein